MNVDVADVAALQMAVSEAEKALRKIAAWHGEFPATGVTYEDGTPVSYAAAYGSNGERDYMRGVALEALNAIRFLLPPDKPSAETEQKLVAWRKFNGGYWSFQIHIPALFDMMVKHGYEPLFTGKKEKP